MNHNKYMNWRHSLVVMPISVLVLIILGPFEVISRILKFLSVSFGLLSPWNLDTRKWYKRMSDWSEENMK